MTDDLARIFRALRPGGRFTASFKAGDSAGRDSFGRYYNYLSAAEVQAHMAAAADWAELAISENDGTGYDSQPTRWLWLTARKG